VHAHQVSLSTQNLMCLTHSKVTIGDPKLKKMGRVTLTTPFWVVCRRLGLYIGLAVPETIIESQNI